jgi:DNA polymerase III subunit gamma/tau
VEEERVAEEDEADKLSEADKPEDNISLPDLMQVWKELAESFMDDSRSLYVAMTKHEPDLKGSTIHIDVDNAIQADEISERKLQLLNHLRKELNNYAIRIEVRITENNQQQKAYLPKEKLQKLIEKNPDIQRLATELDLDILY